MCNKKCCENENERCKTEIKKEEKRKPKYEKGVDHVAEFYKNLRK